MSLTYKGAIGLLIASLLKSADIPGVEGAIETFLNIAFLIVTAGIAVYGRYRQGDISPLGTKI